MTIFTFETTIEGVELEVEVEYHEHEAQTLEHPGVEEGYDVLGVKILSEGADIMALLEHVARPGHSGMGSLGYDGFLLGLVGDCASYHKHFDVVEEDEGRARFVPSSKRRVS